MGISDVIKNSVLEAFQSAQLSIATIVLTFLMAIVCGGLIYLVYRVNTRSAFYNRDFNKTLVLLPVITAGIMMAMANNLTISLGMVGALSIVRFRNAVKDPLDLVYLFWSITIGIIIGANLFELGIILTLIISVLIWGLDLVPSFRSPCLLVVTAEGSSIEDALVRTCKNNCKHYQIRNRCIEQSGETEWMIEMQLTDEPKLINAIGELKGIKNIHLMSHEGDMRF